MKRLSMLLAAVTVSGCATLDLAVPVGYSGPTAHIADDFKTERAEKIQIFVLESVDGKRIDNGILASRRASQGMGSHVVPNPLERDIPAKPMTVHLIGTHQTGAPIAELLYRAAGQFHSIEGDVQFSPAPGGQYLVTGELAPALSCVWIADAFTKAPVTNKVCTPEKKS